MEHYDKQYCLEVWGDYACFTRPEFKVERVSYDVITPSAARAIFESIFWKPAIKWRVNRIEVLNPIVTMNVRRNEVGAVMGKTPIYIEDKRQQKNALILKQVRYRIWATMEFVPFANRKPATVYSNDEPRENDNPAKYQAIFERRASQGQCFNQPYLGCREYSAFFRLVDTGGNLPAPINETRDLQYMLYDMDFDSNAKRPNALFFHAMMNQGIIDVPNHNSNELLR